MAKSIFKDHKCAYMRVKGSLSSPTKKKKKKKPNKGSSRERMREQAQGQVTRLWSSRTLENEYKHHLR